jgi:hypothetical protein
VLCQALLFCDTKQVSFDTIRDNVTELSKSLEVQLNYQSRLVLPATLQRLLGFERGDTPVSRKGGW